MASAPNDITHVKKAVDCDRIAAGLALVLLAVMPTQKTIKGPLTPSDVVIAIAAVYLVCATVWRRLAGRKDGPALVLPPAAFWMVLAVALLACVRVLARAPEFLSESPDAFKDVGKLVIKEMVQFGELFIVAPIVLLNGFRTRRLALWGVGVWIVMTCLAAFHGLAQGSGASHDPMAVTSLFGSRLIHGGYLALSIPVIWALAMTGRNILLRAGLAAGVFVSIFSVSAFGPFWGAAIGMLFVSLLLPGGRLARLGRVAGCIVVLTASIILAPFADQFRCSAAPLHVVDVDGKLDVSKQYAEWQAAYGLMMATDGLLALGDNFVVGLGPGQYQKVIGQYAGFLILGKIEKDSQNQYLVLGSTLGFTGILALALLVGQSITAATRVVRDKAIDPQVRAMAAGLVGSLVAFCVVSFYVTLIVRGTGVTVMLVLSLALVLLRITHEEGATKPRLY